MLRRVRAASPKGILVKNCQLLILLNFVPKFLETMGIVIGIDVGGSTTKIVGINRGKIQSPMFITAADPVTSLFGAFGKYIYDNGIQLSDVEQVMLTGVGSAFVDSPLYGLPTRKTDEFIANGLGARHATDIDRLIVVSMGTGTSFVKIDGDKVQHIGGWGLVEAPCRDFRGCCSKHTTFIRLSEFGGERRCDPRQSANRRYL